MRKTVGLMLIAILALSSLIIKPVNSEITKPSVPEFIIKLVDHSFDVPTTYSTDPYTGASVTHPSYHVTNRTVELIIKNQPFVSTSVDGWTISFFYNVRIKGHYGGDWLNLYNPTVTPYYAQKNSENTVISFGYSTSDSHLSVGPLSGLPLNAEIDFQVQALVGYVHRISNGSATDPLQMFPWVFDGETSGWSNTQTITISNDSTTSPTPTAPTNSGSQNPTSTSGQSTIGSVFFGLDLLGVIIVVMLGLIVVFLVFVVFYLRRRSVGGSVK